MVTRAQRVRLGIFIMVAVLALVISIGVIVAPRFLEEWDIYYIGFRNVSVSGLQEGSAVKYQGLQVGYVSDISIDPEDIRRVIVEVSLEEGTPIKNDTEAQIAMLGITGLKIIELKSGSREAESLAPGSFINAGKSITEEISGHAESLAAKSEIILNNLAEFTRKENLDAFVKLVDQSNRTMNEIEQLVRNNRRYVNGTLENTLMFSERLDTLSNNANRILVNVEEFTGSDTLRQIARNLADVTSALKEAELVQLFKEINTTLEKTNNMLRDVEISFAKSRTDLVYTIERLKETSDNLTQFSRLISEDPSVLLWGAEPENAPDFNLEK